MQYFKQAFELIASADTELLKIIATTMLMSFFSTLFSSLIGLPLGVFLGCSQFKGKSAVMKLLNTLMSLPPVVAGLVVFMLFRSVGPFGSLHIMFSVPVMIIAQIVLITPVTSSLSAAAAGDKLKLIGETAAGLGMSKIKRNAIIMRECLPQFFGIVLLAFGRSVAEVGAVSLVGGNIQFKTRVMTTAILLEANKGNFEKALALGIVLLFISLIVNVTAHTLQEKIK